MQEKEINPSGIFIPRNYKSDRQSHSITEDFSAKLTVNDSEGELVTIRAPHKSRSYTDVFSGKETFMVKTIGIAPELALHRCFPRAQIDVVKTLGNIPQLVLRRRFCRTLVDAAKTLGITPEPVLLRWLRRT